jgi:hypothetical protein
MVDGGWWMVDGGWWMAEDKSRAAVHHPPTTTIHHSPFTIHYSPFWAIPAILADSAGNSDGASLARRTRSGIFLGLNGQVGRC